MPRKVKAGSKGKEGVNGHKTKKRKTESDESDFVMGEEGGAASEDESIKSDPEEEGEEAVQSDGDLESVADGAGESPAILSFAKRYVPHADCGHSREGRQEEPWMGQQGEDGQEASCQSVSAVFHRSRVDTEARHRGKFSSGVKPLGQSVDVRNAIKNMSEDLPPMNDIESMFDHLVSRVSYSAYYRG